MAQDISIAQIEPHPLNSNVMSEPQLRRLQRHIRQSGRYESLVVRPLPQDDGRHGGRYPPPVVPRSACPTVVASAAVPPPRYQVLNGHHRLEVLRRLGHATARCEVWEVDDREALLLLATLNRLEGRDDPMRRSALLSELAKARGDGPAELRRLARLLPEDQAALERALLLARRSFPAPAPPRDVAAALKPLTFFLERDELDRVTRALRLAERGAAEEPGSAKECGTNCSQSVAAVPQRGRGRAAALVRLAEAFLAADV